MCICLGLVIGTLFWAFHEAIFSKLIFLLLYMCLCMCLDELGIFFPVIAVWICLWLFYFGGLVDIVWADWPLYFILVLEGALSPALTWLSNAGSKLIVIRGDPHWVPRPCKRSGSDPHIWRIVDHPSDIVALTNILCGVASSLPGMVSHYQVLCAACY